MAAADRSARTVRSRSQFARCQGNLGYGSGDPGKSRKHGIADDDMIHAYRNPIRVFDLDDLIMIIGPDQATTLLEIGIAHAEGIDFLVHAMVARSKFLE